VQRLIAGTFIPNPLNLPEVDHFPNRDKTANFVENLRWADRKMQLANRQVCKDSLAKYGVRECDCPAAYRRAYIRAYRTEQKAQGRHYLRCPDGKRRYLTDSEFAALYG